MGANVHTLAELTSFFGWCTLINMGLLIFSSLMLVLFQGLVKKYHAKMMKVDEETLPGLYFDYLGKFKVLTIIFNLTPWIALKLMA